MLTIGITANQKIVMKHNAKAILSLGGLIALSFDDPRAIARFINI
jgi:hypothetical protein